MRDNAALWRGPVAGPVQQTVCVCAERLAPPGHTNNPSTPKHYKLKCSLLTYLVAAGFGRALRPGRGGNHQDYVVTYQVPPQGRRRARPRGLRHCHSIYEPETGGQLFFTPRHEQKFRVQRRLFTFPVEIPCSDATALPGPDDDWWISHCRSTRRSALPVIRPPRSSRAPRAPLAELPHGARGARTRHKLPPCGLSNTCRPAV